MQPTIIQDAISVAANSINENVIVSNAALRGLLDAPYPSRIRLLAVISATGLRLDASHGASRYVAGADLRVSASTPDDPLDVVNDEAYTQAGEQMVLRAVNTTGGAITLRYMLILEPMVGDDWAGGQVELPPDTLVMQRGPVTVTAVTLAQQLLDGLAFERIPVPSILTVFMTQSATGITREVFVGQDRIAPPSTISLNNRIPQDPFDMTVNGVEVPANELQALTVANVTVGGLSVFWKTKNQQLIRRN